MIERSERLNPTVNQVLFVSEKDVALIKHWPTEFRALFDPEVDRELSRRITQERVEPEQTQEKEIPF